MPHRSLINQLAALQVRLSLARDPAQRLVLRVELADVELRLAHMLARSPSVEPLTKLVAQLATRQIGADQAGHAIARDPGLAAQVAQVTMAGAQTGDIQMGNVAGRDVVNIYIGERAP
jgi:hypothetical protein